MSIRIAGREGWVWLGVDRRLKCTVAAEKERTSEPVFLCLRIH